MKKVFNFLIVLTICFTASCQNKNSHPEKLVREISADYEGNKIEVALFSYDDKNRLTEYIGYGGNFTFTYTYSSSGDYVTIERNGSALVNLNPDGYVKDFTMPEKDELYYSYAYDDGYIKERKIRHSSGQIALTTKFIWNKGNLVSIVNEDERENRITTMNFEYNTTKNKGNFDFVTGSATTMIAGEYCPWEALGLLGLGKNSKNLVSKIEHIKVSYDGKIESQTGSYNYKLDKDGYVTEVITNVDGKDVKSFISYE